MTGSDSMMISAIIERRAFNYNSREVRPEGDIVHVSLHGVPCITVDFRQRLVMVKGDSLNSRKSAKVFNAVLKTFTEVSAKSDHGKWSLSIPVGMEVDFSGERIGVPISKTIVG